MGAGPLVEVMNVLAVQMGKIDKFTKSQLSTLKKRVKTLREQVKDVKEGEGNNKMTQVRHLLAPQIMLQEPFQCIIDLERCTMCRPRTH